MQRSSPHTQRDRLRPGNGCARVEMARAGGGWTQITSFQSQMQNMMTMVSHDVMRRRGDLARLGDGWMQSWEGLARTTAALAARLDAFEARGSC